MPAKVNKPATGPIWIDWVVIIGIVAITAITRPFSPAITLFITVLLVTCYWTGARRILIALFPGLYREYSCNECSTVVPADAGVCPNCSDGFEQIAEGDTWR